MNEARVERLNAFTTWVQTHIKGDEKGEAQVYLDRLFQAFGHGGVKEAGAILEERIKKEDGKGTAFADLVWKPVVLIEMKKRGENLAKHYRQAFSDWTRLVPNRPNYVILCNFDEFWIYDFDTQMDSPVDKVPLVDLHKRWGPLAFLFVKPETPRFGNDQLAVTRLAADHLAECFNKMTVRGVDRALAQRFILQMLVALFAEDIDLLDRYLVARLLDDCKTKQDSYDLLGGLFDAMNTPGKTPGGRYAGVDYFNGGLFREAARVELRVDEVAHLKAAADADWSKVRPEIFGSLFEHSLGKEERHAFGAHFTSATDIMKIVGPTIVEPWSERIEAAGSVDALLQLKGRLEHLTVLDPACGSGNFLYIAYREMKRLEARILERLAERSDRFKSDQRLFGFVTARQFFGLDINPFAIELAKVTMMIARKFAIDEVGATENALPLDNLDENFLVGDALIDSQGKPTAWPYADVIIGNPPFLGAKRLKPEHGADYVNAVRKAYPDVPGMADYCVYWFRKSHDQLSACTLDDPFAGRAGLVGTQNIRNNQSRVGGLDHVVKDGTIIEAVENQPWSGEAVVHVSIANWVKSQDIRVLPNARRLWFKNEESSVRRTLIASKDQGFLFRDVEHINAALSDKTDTTETLRLSTNTSPQRVFNGQYPRHSGFRLSPSEALAMLSVDPRNREVVHPYLIGQIMITLGNPVEWVIDFQKRSILEAQAFTRPFKRVQETVLPHIRVLAGVERERTGKSRGQDQNWLQTWWLHFRARQEMHDAIGTKSRFVACCEVTKRPIFCFVHRSVRPDKTMEIFAFDDDYSFGILQSASHWSWFVTKCSKFKADFRYTPESVFDTFPWPQAPTISRIDAVAAAGREVRRVRTDALGKIKGGLRAVYKTLELPGKNPLKDAHVILDLAVMAAYGFSAKQDLLGQLLALNLDVARRESEGLTATAPGIPPGYPDLSRLVTDDCIRA